MNFNLERLTEKSREALFEAQEIARCKNHQQTDGWHLLHALVKQENGVVPGILTKLEITPSAVELALERELDRIPSVRGDIDASRIYVTQTVQDALAKAEDAASRLKDDYISTEHLFLGLIGSEGGGNWKEFFSRFGLDEDRVLDAMKQVRGNQKVTSTNPEATYEALEKYGIDLVEEAKRGKLDPVIGRDGEIRRVIRILSPEDKKQSGLNW